MNMVAAGLSWAVSVAAIIAATRKVTDALDLDPGFGCSAGGPCHCVNRSRPIGMWCGGSAYACLRASSVRQIVGTIIACTQRVQKIEVCDADSMKKQEFA